MCEVHLRKSRSKMSEWFTNVYKFTYVKTGYTDIKLINYLFNWSKTFQLTEKFKLWVLCVILFNMTVTVILNWCERYETTIGSIIKSGKGGWVSTRTLF